MPRFLVECSLQAEGSIGVDFAAIIGGHGERSAEVGAIWLHAYLSDDDSTLYALYDAPDPETVRSALARDRIPIERICHVQMLDPTAWRKADRNEARGLVPGALSGTD